MLELRRQFLAEGQERARQLLLDLDGQFNANDTAKAVHTWIGTGGLLGYMAISRQAREAEALLMERPLENDRLREVLTNLALAFNSPREAREEPLSETILQTLEGKRVALVALPTPDSLRMCVALERTRGVPVFFGIAEPPRSEALLDCDLIVVHVRPETMDSPWLEAAALPTSRPIVFMGSRDHLLALDPAVQGLACEFLMDPWQPAEALVRLSLAISKDRTLAPRAALSGAVSGRIRVAVVDDDPTVRALVRTALENFGMECFVAADGPSALDTIRLQRPHAAVLDVNMPEMDGYEVLAAIRQEGLPVRVLLLTARQQEDDVLRGFTLGADDYVVKPFSPMELVARLKRLLSR
jgi:CheY-like chemotaxis protein